MCTKVSGLVSRIFLVLNYGVCGITVTVLLNTRIMCFEDTLPTFRMTTFEAGIAIIHTHETHGCAFRALHGIA